MRSPCPASGIVRALRRLGERAAHAAARAELLRQHPDHALAWHARALAWVDEGQPEQALALRHEQASRPAAVVPWMHWAEQHQAAGQDELAVDALRRALRRPEPGCHLLPVDPLFAPLHHRIHNEGSQPHAAPSAPPSAALHPVPLDRAGPRLSA